MTTPSRSACWIPSHVERAQERECAVVIPVYNSHATLPILVDRLVSVLPAVVARFEVVLVNDGSQDESWAAICQAARKYQSVRGIDLMRNYGQHNALLAGIRAVRYAITVTMDDDLQHPPEEIPRLLGTLAQGHDLVARTAAPRPFTVWLAQTRPLDDRPDDHLSRMAAAPREPHGIVVVLLGFGALAFVLISYLATGTPLSVFRCLVSVLAIISGAQLIALGIMGEYVARIHHHVLTEPAYVVRERIGEPGDGDA